MPNKEEIHGDPTHRGSNTASASLKSESEESTPGVYLLAFQAKYVTNPLHLEENSNSIQ